MKGTEHSTDEGKRYLIDSCGWIEFFSDGPLADEFTEPIVISDPKTHFTSTIVIYEVYKRIRSIQTEESALNAIAHIMRYSSVIQINDNIAISAADISIKHKIPMADSMILATARDTGAVVFTCDKDLNGLDDVVFHEKRSP